MPVPEQSPRPRRLLVFDWDGTVMDSIGTIVECTLHTLRDLEIAAVEEGRIRDAVGLGLAEVFDRLYPGSTPEERNRVIERYRRHWIDTYSGRSLPVSGAADTLTALAAAGHRLAVATGKSRTGLLRDFATTGLAAHFVATRTVSEAPSKPHPGMLLDLMEELGASPEETLMIGDTTHDLEMARAAGCAAVGVLTGSHGREELLAAGAVVCLDSLCALPAWLTDAGSPRPARSAPGP